MSLTQHPDGDSWPYLVESLKSVRGRVALEVLAALARVPQRPKEPEPYRQVILLAQQLRGADAQAAIELLNHWSGKQESDEPVNVAGQIKNWQSWYAQNFPAAPPAELPQDSGRDKWSYEELLTYLEGDAVASADAKLGEQAFATAQCVKCHRCGHAWRGPLAPI